MLTVLTGMLVGAWHVVSGPDHLAALAPLTTARGTEAPRDGAKIGLAWGLGHTGAVWLVGGLLLAFGSMVPLDGLGLWSERLVGLVLMGVGAWGLWRLRTPEDDAPDLDTQTPGHADFDHADFGHTHAAPRSTRSALAIGFVHGLAGGSHLYGVLPALALVADERLAYLGGFGLGSIVAMAWLAAILVSIVRRLPGSRATVRRWTLLATSVAALIIGALWFGLSW